MSVWRHSTAKRFRFASESASKLDSLDSRIQIRIRQIEYAVTYLSTALDGENSPPYSASYHTLLAYVDNTCDGRRVVYHIDRPPLSQ